MLYIGHLKISDWWTVGTSVLSVLFNVVRFPWNVFDIILRYCHGVTLISTLLFTYFTYLHNSTWLHSVLGGISVAVIWIFAQNQKTWRVSNSRSTVYKFHDEWRQMWRADSHNTNKQTNTHTHTHTRDQITTPRPRLNNSLIYGPSASGTLCMSSSPRRHVRTCIWYTRTAHQSHDMHRSIN